MAQTDFTVPDPDTLLEGRPRANRVRFEEEAGEPLSPREVRARHLGDPVCAGCHAQTDPLGYPFDAFDSLAAAPILAMPPVLAA